MITAFFLAIGCFFILLASVGLIRLPDFYSRVHPAGKSDTLGQTMVLTGLIIYQGFSLESIKLVLIILFVFVTNPTATHALVKAAYLSGVKPGGGSGATMPRKLAEREPKKRRVNPNHP